MKKIASAGQIKAGSTANCLSDLVAWYFNHIYQRWEGPGIIPYYCDPARIGAFAVATTALASGDAAALFQLFITMTMYQARRDTVIMAQQLSLTKSVVRKLTSPKLLQQLQRNSSCACLRTAAKFDQECSVQKQAGLVTCSQHPSTPCHVKEASEVMLRMGDMGKIPTSAWLHCWKDGQLTHELQRLFKIEKDSKLRAKALVKYFQRVHRVGQKLATMFVSALSVPALAPGLTPWYPEVDGSELIVIDTNVAQLIDQLQKKCGASTYEARARWLRIQAKKIDLSKYHPTLPAYSPRLVQQALYHFGSKSNRVARGDICCSTKQGSCSLKSLCPVSA